MTTQPVSGNEWCFTCQKQDFEKNMVWVGEHLYCTSCAPNLAEMDEEICLAEGGHTQCSGKIHDEDGVRDCECPCHQLDNSLKCDLCGTVDQSWKFAKVDGRNMRLCGRCDKGRREAGQ